MAPHAGQTITEATSSGHNLRLLDATSPCGVGTGIGIVRMHGDVKRAIAVLHVAGRERKCYILAGRLTSSPTLDCSVRCLGGIVRSNVCSMVRSVDLHRLSDRECGNPSGTHYGGTVSPTLSTKSPTRSSDDTPTIVSNTDVRMRCISNIFNYNDKRERCEWPRHFGPHFGQWCLGAILVISDHN